MKSIFAKTTICLSVLALLSFRSHSPGENYTAFFLANRIQFYENTELVYKYTQGRVFIMRQESQKLNPFYGKYSGTVLFNGSKLAYNQSARGYFDTIVRNDQDINWSVSNSDIVPLGFSYNSQNSYPLFDDGGSKIPGQLKRIEDYKIDLQNSNGYDEIEFMIEDSRFHLEMPWYRRIPATSMLVIPKEALSGLTGPVLRVKLVLIKNEEFSSDGKKFKFENRLELVKKVELAS